MKTKPCFGKVFNRAFLVSFIFSFAISMMLSGLVSFCGWLTAFLAAMLVLLALFAFSLYMSYRNNLVYEYRVTLLWKDMSKFDMLPSYDTMFWQLFTFDWSYCWDNNAQEAAK